MPSVAHKENTSQNLWPEEHNACVELEAKGLWVSRNIIEGCYQPWPDTQVSFI